jgi:hypothetical protein
MSIWDTLGIGGGDDNVNIGLSPSEQQAGGYTRQTDMFGGPAYGYNGGWYNGDKLDPTKSASEMDVARYRDMGGQQTAAPFIDRTQTNESRGMLMGSLSPLQAGAEGWSPDQHALAMGAAGDTRDLRQLGDASAGNTEDMGLLRTAAEGNAPSRAEILGQAMSDRALRSQVSAAGSVRGGPGASAAAYRYASQNAMQNRADMNAGIQAARADELAQARGAYSGAMGAARRDYGTLSGQARRDYGTLAGQARRDYNIGASGAYGQDSDLAYKQALLQEQQNQENAQNQRYYEGLASQTRQFDQQARAGAMGAQTAQTNWQRTNQNAEKAADWQKTKDTVGLVGAVGSGATSGYANMAAADYYNNNQPSDVTSKEPVTYGSLAPITWGTAESDSKSKAKHSLGQRTDPYPDSIDPSFYNSIPLRDTVGTYAGGIYRSNPYGEGPNDTPGLTSDPSAKRAAFAAGMNYAQENVDKGEAGPVPAEYAPKKPGERETKTFQRQDAGKAGEALRHEEASRQDLKKADQSAARLNPVATGAYAASSLGHGYAAQDQWNQSLGPVQNMSTPALPAPPANATPYASFSRADSYRSPEDYQQLSDPETKAAVKDAGGSVYYDPKGEPYARFGDIDIAIQEKPR